MPEEYGLSKKSQLRWRRRERGPTRRDERRQERQEQSEQDHLIYRQIEERSYDWSQGYNVCEYCRRAPAQQMHHDPQRSLGGYTSLETVFHVCLECHTRYHNGDFSSEEIEEFRSRV